MGESKGAVWNLGSGLDVLGRENLRLIAVRCEYRPRVGSRAVNFGRFTQKAHVQEGHFEQLVGIG